MIPIQSNKLHAEMHYAAVRNTVLHHAQRILDTGGIEKRPRGAARHTIPFSPQLQRDLSNMVNDPETYLRPLITETPEELIDHIIGWHQSASPYIDLTSEDHQILTNLFIKSIYETALDKWEFISRLNIDTCCYCNRNYIFATGGRRRTKPEIDHFYPKSRYPMLGLSYYNLIPSCEPCNGLAAKGERDPFSENMTNPYLLQHSDFIFSHTINNIAIINPLAGRSDITVFLRKKIQSHCDVFHLEDIYARHQDHAIELIIKQRLKYSRNYKKYLQSYDGLKFSRTEIDRMILGNYSLEKEQHKRPLSKLYQDLGRELGLIQ